MYLLRHTRVAVPAGVCYGRADVPLADDFTAAAEAARRGLPAGLQRIVTSPSSRCRRLAAALAASPVVDPRLQELDFGAWELRRWDDLPRAAVDHWAEDFVHRAPPEGETFADLALRATAAARAYYDGVPTLFVTHAGVIRALLARGRGLPLREAFSLNADYGGLHALHAAP